MKVRHKEDGKMYDAIQWAPGVKHIGVLRENPPTRGEPSGSGTLLIGGSVLPGEWLVCADGGNALAVLQSDPSEWEDFEIVDENDDPDTKKLCPIMQVACVECKCAWYEKNNGLCGVFTRLLD